MRLIGAVLIWVGVLIGVGVLGIIWLRVRWLRRAATRIAAEIAPLTRAQYRFTGLDEKLRERSMMRREAAESIRGRAARLESGSSVSDLLRRVK